MSYQATVLNDVNRHLGYAESIIALRNTLADGEPLTPPQRALIEVQMNMISGEVAGGSAILPALEDASCKDEPIMLGLDDLLRKILVMVYETLVKLVKWAAMAITKLFHRARGLLMHVRDTRREISELRGLDARIASFNITGQLAQDLAYGVRFSLTYDQIHQAVAKSKGIADVLMNGSYSASLINLGNELSKSLAAVSSTDPVTILGKVNKSVEKAISDMGFATKAYGRETTELIGNMSMIVTTPNVNSLEPVTRSREIQTFDIAYETGLHQVKKIAVDTLTVDQLNVMLGNIENGLLLILDYEKQKKADGLLKTAGELQTQLHKTLRDLDHLRSTPELNDCMVALSRYMTAYAAWVQDPIDHYARYFLNLNASLLQICRLSMRQYA